MVEPSGSSIFFIGLIMKRVLFLDRDGIVNVDTVDVHKKEDFVFTPDIFEVCKYAQDNGYYIIIMSNQTGVTRNVFTQDDVDILHRWVKESFKAQGIDILDFFYCTEYKSFSRKPQPGMFFEAAARHEIDIPNSLMVGDKVSDRIDMDKLRSYILKSQYTKDNEYDIESLLELKHYM